MRVMVSSCLLARLLSCAHTSVCYRLLEQVTANKCVGALSYLSSFKVQDALASTVVSI